jgi:hypothetical protein
LADDYKMTDMRNDMGSVMESMRRGESDFAPKWGAMEKNVAGSIGNAPATDAVSGMKDVLQRPKPLVMGRHE